MVPLAAPRLVERERDVAAVVDALARGDAELLPTLVTITGPVGVGKTALARRVAAEMAQRGIADVVAWVDAGAAAPTAVLRRAIADGRSNAGPSRGGATLIVADGCDHEGSIAVLAALMLEEPGAATCPVDQARQRHLPARGDGDGERLGHRGPARRDPAKGPVAARVG